MINFFLKIPIDFKDICKIYPPSINQTLTEKDFFKYRAFLTLSQEDLEDEYADKVDDKGEPLVIPTPFQFLLVSAYNDLSLRKIIEESFYFFTKEKISFLFDREEIWFCDLEEVIKNISSLEDLNSIKKITKDNFFDFQNVIRQSIGENTITLPNPDEDPRIRRIKAKARYRDRIKAKKGLGLNLESSLVAICCMGIGLNPLNIGEMSFAAINPLIEMYQDKERYLLDIESLLAGADSKKIKPKYWIKNLENK